MRFLMGIVSDGEPGYTSALNCHDLGREEVEGERCDLARRA